MSIKRPDIQPLKSEVTFRYLTDSDLDQLQAATLQILAEVGVKFPSKKALSVFAEHGAAVDFHTQIVKIQPDLVAKALDTVPRTFNVGGRSSDCDFQLQKGLTFFTTDGCGVETVDLDTGQQRPSRKEDVAMMAHIVDYLPSMAFYWPMVSAQDYGRTAPLHELDASWNNTGKHVQSETLMGEEFVRYALEMSTVIAGSKEELRNRPVLSVVICTIAPLAQDKEGIEGAMMLAEAGVPVGFLAMPTLGTTAPATLPAAFVVGDAEIISACVLTQLVSPGCPVFHSIMHGWADPRTGGYVPYPVNGRCRFAPVEMAHHWGMVSFGGAFGTESVEPGTWQSAAEVALDPLLIGMAGAEWVTGIGLNRSFTLLHPEAIIYDDELYHRARYALQGIEISQDNLALDVIRAVGPGGHFLAQKHTRKHMRTAMVPGIAQQLGPDGKYRQPAKVAREKVRWILGNYQPEPLEEAKQVELGHILAVADRELG